MTVNEVVASTDAGGTTSGETSKGNEILSAKEIRRRLDQVVIGQVEAKRALASGVSMHLKRGLMTPEQRAETDKSNILVVGPRVQARRSW